MLATLYETSFAFLSAIFLICTKSRTFKRRLALKTEPVTVPTMLLLSPSNNFFHLKMSPFVNEEHFWNNNLIWNHSFDFLKLTLSNRVVPFSANSPTTSSASAQINSREKNSRPATFHFFDKAEKFWRPENKTFQSFFYSLKISVFSLPKRIQNLDIPSDR